MDNSQNPHSKFNPIRSIILAVGNGVLMGLATAPLNLFPLAWVALVPLWLFVLERSTPKTQQTKERRFWLLNPEFLFPLGWGMGYHGFSLAWITGLHPLTWLGMPWIASIAIALSCWLCITLWGAVFVVLWAWATLKLLSAAPAQPFLPSALHSPPSALPLSPPPSLFTRLLLGTALWCGLEWLWSLSPLWWTALAFTQSPGNLAILHLGRLSGPATVTAAIVAVNGIFAALWRQVKMQKGEGKRQNALKPLTLNIAFLIVLHLAGFVLYSQPLVQAPGTTFKIGIIQGNIPTRIKLTPTGIRQAESRYTTGYEQLVEQGAEAVLTPEGALPFLWDGTNQRNSSFYQAVLRKGVVAWLGTFTLEDGGVARSLLTIAGTGETVSRYDKIKLVPLGEYIPLRNLLGGLIGLLSPIELDGTAGTLNQQMDTPVGRAIASICYDSAFPQVFQTQAARGGEFILTASNLDPYNEVLMAQHQAQDLMRAIETDRWAARATNTGYSGIIDPHGHIVWRSEPWRSEPWRSEPWRSEPWRSESIGRSQPNTYQIHADSLYRRQTRTLYVRWGDWLTPLLLGLAFLLVLGHYFRQERSRRIHQG
jgi:apolipoprotein N-acyltransferase